MYLFLAACARPELRPEHTGLLRRRAEAFSSWEKLPAFAEEQRMGPLFYVHARAAGLRIPAEVWQQFQGLYLRHRQANQARTRVVSEILEACQRAGIRVVLLKGAALFHLVYPEPGLRPMRDIDLLACPKDALEIQRILGRLGFAAPLPAPGEDMPTKHMPIAYRQDEGICHSVEVHHNLFDELWRPGFTPNQVLVERARPFTFNGQPAYTLSLEDMLWHLYQHMVVEEVRLIGIADITGLAEKFVDEIDWNLVSRRYPAIPEMLSVLNSMSPLSPELVEKAGLRIGPAPDGIGEDMQGWPYFALGTWRTRGARQFIKDTLFPSEWWLRLYYGVGVGRSLGWQRSLGHPLHLLYLAGIRQCHHWFPEKFTR